MPEDWWKKDLGPPMPRREWTPHGRPRTHRRGNPNFLNPETRPTPPTNGKVFTPGDPRISPGGAVSESKKHIRNALLRMMKDAPGVDVEPRTKAEEIARRLYKLSQSADDKAALAAIRELMDRLEGKAAPSKEETDAIAAGGAKVVLIDSRMLPPAPQPYIDAEESIDLLEEPEEDQF